MRILFSLLVFIVAFQNTFSQTESTTSSVVETYKKEANNYKNKLGVIDNVIIRSDINRFENIRTSFQLRLLLNSFGVIKTNKEKIEITKQLKLNDYLIERNKFLKSHYDHIINYYESTIEYEDLKKSLKNGKKADSLYNVYIKSYQEIDFKDYIANKQALLSLETKANNYSYLLDSIKKHISTDFYFKNIDEIEVKNIKKALDSLKKVNAISIVKENQKLKIDLLESTINHQKAKRNQFIEGIIMSYNVRDDLILNDRFLIGLSLKLPWFDSTNKNKINELQFEKNTQELNSEIVNENSDFEINRICKEFEINYKNYQTIVQHTNELSSNEAYNLILNSGKVSIFEILELEKHNQSLQKELKDYKVALLKLYLEFLLLNGQLEEFDRVLKG